MLITVLLYHIVCVIYYELKSYVPFPPFLQCLNFVYMTTSYVCDNSENTSVLIWSLNRSVRGFKGRAVTQGEGCNSGGGL